MEGIKGLANAQNEKTKSVLLKINVNGKKKREEGLQCFQEN